jgi:beta-glucosidase
MVIKRTNVFGVEIAIDKRSPEEMIKEAVDVAGKADVIVAVLGESRGYDGRSFQHDTCWFTGKPGKFIKGPGKNRKACCISADETEGP